MIYGFIKIIVFFSLLLISVSYVLGERFNRKAIYPHNWQYKETLDKEIRDGVIEEGYFEALEKEAFEILSERGYVLKGYWIQGGDRPTDKTIIICHGITNNLMKSLKYLEPFIERGYNAVIYDHKNHGESGGDYTTFGVEEKLDLKQIVDYVVSKVGEAGVIGTHGESMGAATVLEHVKIDPRIAFVISDCAYKSAEAEFAFRLKVENHLPAFPILNVASLINKMRYGITFKEMSPIRMLETVDQPILFIHGLADDYIPYSHSQDMFAVKKDKKALYLVPKARHAMSIIVDRAAYIDQINQFLDRYGF